MADFEVKLELLSQQVEWGAAPVLVGGLFSTGNSCAPCVALSLYDANTNELIGRPLTSRQEPLAAGVSLSWQDMDAVIPCQVSPQVERWPLEPGTYLLVAQAWAGGSSEIVSEVTYKFEVLPPPPPPEE